MEIYLDIEDFPNYQVSNLGNVKSLDHYAKCKNGVVLFFKGRILKKNASTGYEIVQLSKDGVLHPQFVHRLVAKAFIPNPEEMPCVNHKNEIKNDNRVENLEWCSYQYNNSYGTKRERISKSRIGKGHPHTAESKEKIKNALIGKVFSEEHKQNLKKAWETRVVSDEQKERCRTLALGHHHSEESKKKMSDARKRYWEDKHNINKVV